MKQTAVDWQFDQLSSENLLGVFTYDQMTRVMEILEQAKEMEKEQIIQSVTFGQNNHTVMYSQDLVIANDYYKLTYRGNK